jgi:uncharacterized protein
MEYKKSRFNYELKIDDKIIVFNSLRNTFSLFSQEEYYQDIKELSDKSLNFMKQQGVLVDSDFDEEKSAFLKYMSIVDDGVLTLIILPTMKCNFRCPYCYEDKSVGKMSDEVIDSIVEFAKKKISTARSLHVSWFGGEPLLCMDVISKLSERLMKLARDYHKSYSSNMTTNGYLLDLETFKTLLYKYKVTHYQITLDGREQYHNKTRPLANGQGTYQTIMNNLINIKNNVKTMLFTILIRTNLTKETLNDFENHVLELNNIFGDDKRFCFLFKEVGNWGGETVNNISDSLLSGRDYLLNKLATLDIKLQLSGQFIFFNRAPICYAAKKDTYTIGPKGNIMKCTVNLEEDWNNIGILDKSGNIDDMDQSKYMRWQYGILPNKTVAEKCKDCKLYANCFGISCPIHYIKRGTATKCQDIENEMRTMYKYSPELFKVATED